MSASLVVVLAEDFRAQSLARHLLIRLGYARHEIRLAPLPAGRGSGFGYIISEYPKQVEAIRQRQAKTLLLTHIDADQKTVAERLAQLQEKANSEAALEDCLFHWIPKRNIETWLIWLLEPAPLNEEVDYKEQFSKRFGTEQQKSIERAAVKFFAHSRPNAAIPPNCPPSLKFPLQNPPPGR